MKKKTLGMMISSLRKENGMTQQDLADRMGVTDKAVSKWERDLSCPDVNSLPKLAEIFEVSVDELMQVKQEAETRKDYTPFIKLVLRGVALAMGVSVTVLSILNELEVGSALGMLGIGLAALSATAFLPEDEK
ncbi:MAG: helix-turn-helix domain-containing protein [Clostridia bacterium]|nr:helix-turn-helix domain-containing protein [Clostridia bacterium]